MRSLEGTGGQRELNCCASRYSTYFTHKPELIRMYRSNSSLHASLALNIHTLFSLMLQSSKHEFGTCLRLHADTKICLSECLQYYSTATETRSHSLWTPCQLCGACGNTHTQRHAHIMRHCRGLNGLVQGKTCLQESTNTLIPPIESDSKTTWHNCCVCACLFYSCACSG